MTTQTPSEFIAALTEAAKAKCNPRKVGRGLFGEGKAEAALPDGRIAGCTYSVTTSLYGREQIRATFTIDGKRASKEQLGVALGARTREATADLNPILRSAFEARAPELAADWTAWMRRVYDRLFRDYNGQIPSWVDYKNPDRYAITIMMREVCSVVNTKNTPINPLHILIMNEETLVQKANKYGDDVATQWFYKTSEKLGKLEDAEVVADSGGHVIVRGKRNGKAIEMRQQRILKCSSKGVLFHQFPARIYVDGKFITEAAYAELMGDKK
jgi:hypothetical protein